MNVSTKTTRRRFLKVVPLLGLVLLFRPARAFSMMASSDEGDLLTAALANVFGCLENAKQIGREYLQCRPTETNADILVDLLCSGRPKRRAEFAHTDLEKRRRLLAMQQIQDFEHGRVLILQGWIVSETEGRLCALAFLQRV